MGVHNLWKTVDFYRIPHFGGLRTLRNRFFPVRPANNNQGPAQPLQEDAPLFPIRVGVDGNNILHAIVRQTNLVRLLINDDPEELATACVIWAKRANSAVLFSHLPKDSRQPFASFSAASYNAQPNQILNNADQQWPQNSKPSNFTPPCKMNFGSDVVAAFSPSASSSPQSSDDLLQNNNNNFNDGGGFSAAAFNRRLVLRETSTSGILFVFDGETPPSKVALREDRARKREQALAEASLLASYGQQDMANKILSSHPSILPKHVYAVAERLSKAGFAVVHAPYESEAQLLYLAEKKLINFVLSSDSDCIVFNPKSTILRMRSVNEFDIYDLPGSLKLNPSSSKLNPATETNVNDDSSFQQVQQEKMSFATQSIKTELEKKNINDMIFRSSRELFAFCCCAAGSDYNAGVGETLPGTALSIYQNLVSQFPRFPAHFSLTSPFNDAVLSSKRFGLDLLSAHRSVTTNSNENNNNNEEEIRKSLVTCRDACNRLLIPPHLALALCKAVYSILQHIVYDPLSEKITTFLPPEQVVDLRHYLQELMSVTNNNNNNSENAYLIDSQIVGRRTPPLSSVSDREWCEGIQGAKYRACRVTPQNNINNNNNNSNPIDSLQKSSTSSPSGSSHFNQTILKLQQTSKKLSMMNNKGKNNIQNFSASSPTFSLFGNNNFAAQNGMKNAMMHEGKDSQSKRGNITNNVLFADIDDGSNNVNENKSANENNNNNELQQQQHVPSPTGFYFCQICESSFRNLPEFEIHLRGKRHEARTKLQSLMSR